MAFDVLLEVATQDAYTNLVLPRVLGSHALESRDRNLATELVYGSSRRQGELDVVLEGAAGRPLTDFQTEVLVILRLALHQMLFLRVPDHAAVDESVELAKEKGLHRATGLINAILRNVTRQPAEHWMGLIAGRENLISSHPTWIATEFDQALKISGGEGQLIEALEAHNVSPLVTLVHLPGFSRPESNPTVFSPLGAVLAGGNPSSVPGVADGRVRVQDEGSQLAALLLSRFAPLKPGERILDMCSGPGGKTAVLGADALDSGAVVVAWEKAPHRARLVAASVAAITRRNRATVTVITGDALTLAEESQSYDRVLLDAPCSGLGALRRRPEARWRKDPADLSSLITLQTKLLHRALDLVAVGGVVAYVTCSPVIQETEGVVNSVMEARGDSELLDTPSILDTIATKPVPGAARGSAVQLWGYRHGCDDMFIQLLRRVS